MLPDVATVVLIETLKTYKYPSGHFYNLDKTAHYARGAFSHQASPG